MAHDVFISHSTEDKAIADAVCSALEAAGVRCWVSPRDILPGQDWASSIVNAISRARAMVLIYSGNSCDSTHVKKELTLAIESNTVILPLRIENIPLTGIMHYYLADTHWLDVMNPPTEHEIRKLVSIVRSLLVIDEDDAARANGSVEEALEAVEQISVTAPLVSASAPRSVSPPAGQVTPTDQARSGAPPSGPASPAAPPSWPRTTPSAQPRKFVMAPWIWAIVAFVAVGTLGAGCLGVTWLLNGDDGGDTVASTEPPVEEPPSQPAEQEPREEESAGAPIPRVTLEWDAPVDLDLEIWTGNGQRLLEYAWNVGCIDIQDGSGPEYFDFKAYDDSDYTAGTYVVSVCFPDEQAEYSEEVPFTLTVKCADGTTLERTGAVAQDKTKNQWHGFVVDGASGAIINDLGSYISTR